MDISVKSLEIIDNSFLTPQLRQEYERVLVQQNGREDNARWLEFSGYDGAALCYRFRPCNVFWGGNTFRYFDCSNIYAPMYNVQKVEEYGGELFDPDREKVAALIANCVMFLDAVKELTDSALDAEAKAINTGYEAGKLRKMESFTANEALFAPTVGGPSSDGVQNYSKRLRAAFEDCKKYYLKTSSRLNGSDFGWK